MPLTAPLVEGAYTGEFVKNIAHGARSMERVVLASGAGALKAGTILGAVTASGKFKQTAPAATDGTQNASGVLIGDADATSADVPVAIIARDAELNIFHVVYPTAATTLQKAAIDTALAARHVLIRP